MTPRQATAMVAGAVLFFIAALLGYGALFHESAHTYEFFEVSP